MAGCDLLAISCGGAHPRRASNSSRFLILFYCLLGPKLASTTIEQTTRDEWHVIDEFNTRMQVSNSNNKGMVMNGRDFIY
jgi:hypothetical protein